MLPPARDVARTNQLLDQLSDHLEGPRGLNRTYTTARNSVAAAPDVAADALRDLAEQLRAAASVAEELAALAESKE